MFKLCALLVKNFKLLWKSKLFFGATLVGPLIIALLFGVAFNNTDAYSITIGVYASNYNNIENDIVDKLRENFNVLKFKDEDFCINTLKDYSIHACIVLPKNIALNTNEISEIIFYVDNSRINLVWLILDTLSHTLEISSSKISTDLTNELLLKLNRAGVKLLRLRNITMQAVSESNNILEQNDQINLEMGSLNLIETQERVEEFILKSKVLETELDSFTHSINKKIDESKDILSDIDSNSSGFDDIKEKLDEIEDLVSDSNHTLFVSELSTPLNELDRNIFKIKETFSTALDKHNENTDSLNKALSRLERAQGLIQEMDKELNELSVTNASKIVNPIITVIRPIANETTYFGFVYPTLIVLMTVFISIFLSSSIIVMEHKSRAFFRNYVSSTSEVSFLVAYFLTDLIIVVGCLSIFVLFAKVFFDMPLNFSFFLILFLIASLFILLGSFIGYVVKSEQSNILAGIIVSSLLVFFSNAIMPVESASQTLKVVMNYNPVVISEVVLRKLLIYKLNIEFLLNDLSLLLTYTLVLAVILFLFLKFVYGTTFKVTLFKSKKKV